MTIGKEGAANRNGSYGGGGRRHGINTSPLIPSPLPGTDGWGGEEGTFPPFSQDLF